MRGALTDAPRMDAPKVESPKVEPSRHHPMIEAQIEGALSKAAGSVDPIAKASATAEFFAANPAAYDDYIASKRG